MTDQSQPLPSENQSYDVFASYASKDNQEGWIKAFIERLQEEHTEHFGGGDGEKGLTVFFDKDEIRSGHNWRHTLVESVQHSSLFIAFVSPNYFASEWCRREWRTWVEAEIGKHILSEGAHPIYIIEVPWLYQEMEEQQVAAELENLSLDPSLAQEANALAEQLSARQSKADVKLFYEQGQQALREEKMIQILQELTKDLSSRSKRIKDAENSFSNVPAYNKHFTGRLTELSKLRISLDDRMTGVITSIQGLGGIGKTELAFTYAHAFASLYPGGRYYLKCEGHAEIRQPVINHLGDHFGKHLSEAERMDPEKFFNGIIATLRQHLHEKGRTLLVLDNVDQESLLDNSQIEQLTDPNGKLHLLATTRLGSYSIQNSSTEWLTLNSLPAADALALLYKFRPIDPTSQPEEHQAALDIVTLLDGFTLTIELTAGYLGHKENQQTTSYASVLQQLKENQDQTLKVLSTDKTAQSIRHNHEKNLATILDFSLKRLTPITRTALAYAAHLPPDSICIPWLKELCLPHHPEINKETKIGSPSHWQTALHQLESLALFTTPETDQQGTLDHRIKRLHRLVASHLLHPETAEQKQLREEEIQHFIQTRDEFLQNQHDWQQTRWEVEPLDALAQYWDEQKHPQSVWLLNKVASRWYSLNHWLRAEPLIRRALAIDEQSFGENYPNVATHLNNLAQLLQATNRLNEAEPLIRRALAIDEQSFGENHPNVAIRLNNLALLLQDTNRLSEAEPLMRRALAIDEQSFGDNHPNIATLLNNLALLLQHTNRLTEAKPLMRRALAIDELSFGENHPTVARDLNNLAELLRATNRHSEAEPLYSRALEIVEKSFGPEHPTVAIGLSNLAELLFDTNRHSEAEPLYRRALVINEKSFGAEHPNVATALNNIAELLRANNRHSEAEPLYRRALVIDEKSYGDKHTKVATGLSNLALLLDATNRPREAEPLLRRALEIDEKSFGAGHPTVAIRLNNLAELLRATSCYSEAEPLYRRALEINENSYGTEHHHIAISLNNLALLLLDTNRHSQAEPLSRRMVLILLLFAKIHGHEHPHLQTAINNYADLLEAMDLLQEDLNHKLLTLGPEAGWEQEEWIQFYNNHTNQ